MSDYAELIAEARERTTVPAWAHSSDLLTALCDALEEVLRENERHQALHDANVADLFGKALPEHELLVAELYRHKAMWAELRGKSDYYHSVFPEFMDEIEARHKGSSDE